MAINFPGSLDTTSSLPATAGIEVLNSAGGGKGLSSLLNDLSSAAIAIDTKVGSGSSTPTTNTVLMGNGSGTSVWSSAPSVGGDFTVKSGHSLALENASGNSISYLYNNGGSGGNILQSGDPVNFTADLKIQSPTNVSKSALTTDGTQTLTNKTLTSPVINQFGTASGLGAAWQSWTPTFTGLSGGTLTFAKYIQVGKTVHFRLYYLMSGANVSGVSLTFTLPVSVAADYVTDVPIAGMANGLDAGAAIYPLAMDYLLTDKCLLRAYGTLGTYLSGAQPVTSTIPFTWGASDAILLAGSYEAA